MYWTMGNGESKYKTVNFDNVKQNDYILIHVMDEKDQSVLIKKTQTIENEVKLLNSLLSESKQGKTNIIIYGKNTDDFAVLVKRYNQLVSLGFNAYIYFGGLFEWLLLQEIYGVAEFPIENAGNSTIDLLKFAPTKK